MNWEEVGQYIRKNSISEVAITYCREYFVCELKRAYYKKLPILRVGKTEEGAYNLAKELFTEVENLEDKHGFLINALPSYCIKGYTHRMYDDYEVSFKQEYVNYYVITDVRRKDNNGYYLNAQPYPIGVYHSKIEDCKDKYLLDCADEEKEYLKEGEELWTYDNIGYLIGAAGFCVVKDGLVIRSKMVMMA